MKENEVIEVLKEKYMTLSMSMDIAGCKKNNQAVSEAINALEEIQMYHKIGTVQECLEAVERQRAKKPNIWGDGVGDDGEIIYDMYDCPNCGKSYEIDYEEYKYCPNCGQAMKIEWR